MVGSLADQPRMIGLAAAGLWRRVSRRLRSGPIARWRFSGRTPDRILIAPPDLRMADAHIAQEFYAGRIALAGNSVETGGASPFEINAPGQEWQAALHNFRWLRHNREAGTELASVHARTLVSDWLKLYGRTIEGFSWEPDIVSKRVIAWLQHSGTLLKDCNLEFYRAFLKSLAFQLRYLRIIAPGLETGEVKLRCRIALVFGALSLPVATSKLTSATRNLESELLTQIFPDGGHISRNPEAVLELLTDLLPLRQTYANQSENPPRELIAAVERMLPALRFFRHCDGALAHFNGAGYAKQERIAAVLRFDDAAGSPLSSASHSGYQRLQMGYTTVVADTGLPPIASASQDAHAGCLSFELSSGRHRYVVNAGTDRFGPADFNLLSRTTAAHSTATVNDTSSCRFAKSQTSRNLFGTPIVTGPRHVPVRRLSQSGSEGFLASHDGFLRSFGVVHERQMILSQGGSVLAGKDRFVDQAGFPLRTNNRNHIALRFHLHPLVAVSHNDDGQIVLTAGRDDSWVFTCGELTPAIDQSVYFAGIRGPQKTKMILLEFDATNLSEVTWQFTRTALGNWSR